jgi:hypothetical protein
LLETALEVLSLVVVVVEKYLAQVLILLAVVLCMVALVVVLVGLFAVQTLLGRMVDQTPMHLAAAEQAERFRPMVLRVQHLLILVERAVVVVVRHNQVTSAVMAVLVVHLVVVGVAGVPIMGQVVHQLLAQVEQAVQVVP